MVVPEKDARLGKTVERRRVRLGDEVRPHSVPDNDDDMLSFACPERGSGKECLEKNDQGDSAHENFSVQIIPSRVK